MVSERFDLPLGHVRHVQVPVPYLQELTEEVNPHRLLCVKHRLVLVAGHVILSQVITLIFDQDIN
jgi:hypothetical protein